MLSNNPCMDLPDMELFLVPETDVFVPTPEQAEWELWYAEYCRTHEDKLTEEWEEYSITDG